jgi:hypothetical protein
MASSGLPRKYRSTEAVEHVLENAADDGLMQVFFSDAAWSLIPPARRTERFQHESFSLLSCIRCVMSEAFFAPHDNFPIRIFKWLSHKDGIAAAVRDEECHKRFDLFTATWVRYWSTNGRSLDSALVMGEPNRGDENLRRKIETELMSMETCKIK